MIQELKTHKVVAHSNVCVIVQHVLNAEAFVCIKKKERAMREGKAVQHVIAGDPPIFVRRDKIPVVKGENL